MSVAVLGAGAFGTALAISLARNGPVTLWCRDAVQEKEMQATRVNPRRLPGCLLPEAVTVTGDVQAALSHDVLLFAVPTQSLGTLVEGLELQGKQAVACCKGIDLQTGQGPSKMLADAQAVAVLTGPSFATDIANGLPTALTLACADEVAGKALQETLSTPTLRLYRSQDVVGAELGGALKNVVALGCGAVMGAGLGPSARAALMTRGFAEMSQVAQALGARSETLMGLSGFGDLALTCTSDTSRNYRHGFALGAGQNGDPAATVEGVATAMALGPLAQKLGLDLPVCGAIADLVAGRIDVARAMQHLLSRPLKPE